MNCPIPNARGTLKPEGTCANGVLILGEAMGDAEAADGLPFRPYAPSGSILERAIRRVGMTREQFVIWNCVPVQPPHNWLEGAPYEHEAIAWGRPFIQDIITRYKPRAIVALGSIATRVTTGLVGRHLGINYLSGYVLPSVYGIPVIPCFHPAYMRRGKMSHFGVLLRTLKLAAIVARESRQPSLPNGDSPPAGYQMSPTEADALEFERGVRGAKFLAYDIETPYSTNEDEAEELSSTHLIKSVQFSVGQGSGIFMPWREPFIEVAKRILATGVTKLGWNNWRFDDPVLAAAGAPVSGPSHDLMWVWHHLQPDLPRNLQFAAGQNGWPFIWKHLDNANANFYGIVDVDVLQYLV